MTLPDAVLALGCAAVAAFHLLRLPVDPIGEGAHGLMGLGMAAMFAPALDPVPTPAWAAAFALVAAWFGAQALRGAGAPAVHHVVGAAAMLLMLLAGHGAAAVPTDGGGGGHVGHGGGPDGGLGLASVAVLVLAAYFVWHLLRCTEPFRGREQAGAVRTRVLRDARVVAAAHAVMAGAMTIMLLGAG